MTKKHLIYLVLFIVIVIAAWLLISFWSYDKKGNVVNNQQDFSQMTARETANWDEPFLKEVKVEFMEKEDLNKMNLPEEIAIRLQVLERDTDGNVTAYKKIYDDDDIVRYKVDYSGGDIRVSDLVSSTSPTSTENK